MRFAKTFNLFAACLLVHSRSVCCVSTRLQTGLSDLPSDALSEINEFIDTSTLMMLGTLSHHYKNETRAKNGLVNAELLEMRKSCETDFYFRTASSGYYLLKGSIVQQLGGNVSTSLTRQSDCIDSFIPKLALFDTRLSILDIKLPSLPLYNRTSYALFRLVLSLKRLFRTKRHFETITVSIIQQADPIYQLHPSIESWLFDILQNVDVDTICLKFEIRHHDAFAFFSKQSTVKSISFHHSSESIYQSMFNLSHLRHVSLDTGFTPEEFKWIIFSAFMLTRVSMDGMFIPYLTDGNSISDLTISSSNAAHSLRPLLLLRRNLRKLSLIEHYHVIPAELGKLLKLNRQTLEYLAVQVDCTYMNWELTRFLDKNSVIRDLSIRISGNDGDSIDLGFIEHAVALNSLSIADPFTDPTLLKTLMFFITSHNSLTTLSLDCTQIHMPLNEFVLVYERLVRAVRFNRSVRAINLAFKISCGKVPKSKLAAEISRISVSLIGRDLTVNSIPIASVVSDLEAPVKGIDFTIDEIMVLG